MTSVPLYVRSQYSILESSCAIKQLVARASQQKYSALGLMDKGNLYGAVDFYKECQQQGIKPLIGCELFVASGSRHSKQRTSDEPVAYPLLLFAMNRQGYQNLCKLSSAGYLEGFYYIPRVDRELLAAHSDGLLALSGPLTSSLSRAIQQEQQERIEEELQWLQQHFTDRLYLQINRNTMSHGQCDSDGMADEPWIQQKYQDHLVLQEKTNNGKLALAQKYNLPIVATHEVLYLEREDWTAHEILLNIQSGEPCEIWERDSLGQPKNLVPNPKRATVWSHAMQWLSPEQLGELFSDVPEALTATRQIAERCNFDIDFKTKHYPVFIPPHLRGRPFTDEERYQEAEQYLRSRCKSSIARKYTTEDLAILSHKFAGQDPHQLIQERLEYELELLISKELGDYILIVHDIIDWAKQRGIPVGPGRGSGAGSIVCYLLDITAIDPLRFDLFFERFINPERFSYPDIDVDICMDRRAEVINYVIERYGKERIAQIITFGTIKAKMAVKDVGRVLSVPLTKINRISKMIPEDLGITIEKAISVDPELNQAYHDDPEVQRILDLGQKIEGCIRNTGVHAAGCIIADRPIVECVPLCAAKDAHLPVTQYAMKPVEMVGMLKMDLLGLKTLTCIQICCEEIRTLEGVAIDWQRLPLDDQATFALLNHGRTAGVFQLESAGMRDLAKQIQIENFEEIIAIVSLYRPGPMEMIPSFVRRKHGKEEFEVDHPEMEQILKETYGIMVYQEQVMQIAQRLAGFSLGEGDVLRRAMGKKDADQMALQRVKFREGAVARGIDSEIAEQIFDKMERFASYGFNKSHAAAYALVAYITAFLKANYPGHWMAALMTCDRDEISKLAKITREVQSMGMSVMPPDINESGRAFRATATGIRFALSGIKGVGEGVVDTLLEERERNGKFTSLLDCLQRVDLKKVPRRALEVLIDAGAFDFTGWSRDALQLSLSVQFDRQLKVQREQKAGILDLFSENLYGAAEEDTAPPVIKETPTLVRWLKEKELLGFFLTGHPLDQYRQLLPRLSCRELLSLQELREPTVVRLACIIEQAETRISQKSGKKFAILQISDGAESFELPIWPELYEQHSALLLDNQLIYVVVTVEPDDEKPRLQAKWLADLTKADEAMIIEADKAADKARASMRYYSQRPPKAAQERAKPNAVTAAVTVQIDVTRAHLSHILEIKAVLRKHKGASPIKLLFSHDSQMYGAVEISSRWGVTPNKELATALKRCQSVLSVKLF